METRKPISSGHDPVENRRASNFNSSSEASTPANGGAIGGLGTGSAGQTADQPADLARTAMSEVQTVAGQVVDQAKHEAETRLGSQFNLMADRLGSVKETFEELGSSLREKDQTWLAPLADQASSQIDRVSGYFREQDLDHVVGDLERLARRQPAIFLGGAVALGVLAARFLRSSRSNLDAGTPQPMKSSRFESTSAASSKPSFDSYAGRSSRPVSSPMASTDSFKPANSGSGGSAAWPSPSDTTVNQGPHLNANDPGATV